MQRARSDALGRHVLRPWEPDYIRPLGPCSARWEYSLRYVTATRVRSSPQPPGNRNAGLAGHDRAGLG